MHLSISNVREKEYNTQYPKRMLINTAGDLAVAAGVDHIAAEMKDGRRANGNFIEADCVIFDLDNTHSEEPENWQTLKDISDAFPEVTFYAVRSRNYMKPKSRTNKAGNVVNFEPREKYHLYFPLSHALQDPAKYQQLIYNAVGVFPYFDTSAADNAHFLFGVEKPHAELIEGELCLDDYISAMTPEQLEQTITEGLDAFTRKSDLDNKGAQQTANKLRSLNGMKLEAVPEEAAEGSDAVSWIQEAEQGKALDWLKEWTESYEVKLGKHYLINSDPHKGGIAFCVSCPWEDEHSMNGPENESVIIVDRGGKLNYLCRHNSCLGKHGWKEYRAKIEEAALTPEYGWKKFPAKDAGKRNDKLPIIKTLNDFEEKEAEWFIQDYIPKGCMTFLGGDGGTAKTFIWCHIVATATSGKRSILEHDIPFDDVPQEGKKVLFFSSEDSTSVILKRRLRKAGADPSRVMLLDLSDPDFKKIKFDSPELAAVIEEYRPDLCVFDPMQSFIPAAINMASRNAMRQCLEALASLGEKYGTSFLVVMHTNKKMNASGRNRLADSADVWDAARSVLIAGHTEDKDVMYLSHEKCNYARTRETILYAIENEAVVFKGTSEKKDADFMREAAAAQHPSPAKEDAKQMILSFLNDKEWHKTKDLDSFLKNNSISFSTLKRAKSELHKSGEIEYKAEGYGEKVFFVKLAEKE